MNLYGLLDTIISKLNKSVKTEVQVLTDAEKKQVRNNINVPSKSEICNPNLLDNWYFANPVNQRGVTSWTSGYGIDRWRVSTGATAEVLSDSLLFTGSSQYQNLEQPIDNFTNLLGKTITLTVLFKENVADATFTTGLLFGSSFYQEFTSGLLYSCTATVPTDATQIVVFVQDTIGQSSCNISAMKLEIGDTQTLAHQDANGNWILNEIPKYSTELLECKRYFQLFPSNHTFFFGTSGAADGTGARLFAPLHIPMRVNQLSSVPPFVVNVSTHEGYVKQTTFTPTVAVAVGPWLSLYGNFTETVSSTEYAVISAQLRNENLLVSEEL